MSGNDSSALKPIRDLSRPPAVRLAVLIVVLAAAGLAAVASAGAPPGDVLGVVQLAPGAVVPRDLPVFAVLRGADGASSVLVLARRETAAVQGPRVTVLGPAAAPTEFVIARQRRPAARAGRPAGLEVVYDDGRQIVVRANQAQANALAEAGYEIVRLRAEPMTPPTARTATSFALVAEPLIAAAVARVQSSQILSIVSQLSGAAPVSVGGEPYTITTRNTMSGTPVEKATQWALERLGSFGLSTVYHNWTAAGISNRNVVATLPGVTTPTEIVLVTAHLDDMPSWGLAPGADDNASGSTAVLQAAEVLAGMRFERTIRFVLFTGEEDGLLGSDRYAALCQSLGENVVAVLNLDMIAWDAFGGPELDLHTRVVSSPGYAADRVIADLFASVVNWYLPVGSLTPVFFADSIEYSDHASFWYRGYPGILAIEDDDDFCTEYHKATDTVDRLNLTYFTSFVRASVATAAHLAELDSSSPTLTVVKRWSGAGTVVSSPTGIDCGATCAAQFASSSIVTLSATALVGSSFAGWGGACSGSASTCEVTMSEARLAYAYFSTPAMPTSFYPLTPCRLLDTRVATGPSAAAPALAAETARTFTIVERCGVPADAVAVSTNVTVVNAAAPGTLRIVPGDMTPTEATTISFPVLRARANNALIKLATDASGTIAVTNDANGEVHLILDVNGYFR
jgi:hypothetical protein